MHVKLKYPGPLMEWKFYGGPPITKILALFSCWHRRCFQHAENCVTNASWPASAQICTNFCCLASLCRILCGLCRNLFGLCRNVCRFWLARIEICALTCHLVLKSVQSLASFAEEHDQCDLAIQASHCSPGFDTLININWRVRLKTWILNEAFKRLMSSCYLQYHQHHHQHSQHCWS